MVAPGVGCVVAPGGGLCMVAPGGVRGCSGEACVVAPRGGGMHGCSGGCTPPLPYEIRPVNARSVRILLECILVEFSFELGILLICILIVFQIPTISSRILPVSKSAVSKYFQQYLH